MRDLHLSGTGKFSSHPSASCPSRKGNEGSFYHPSFMILSFQLEIKLDLSIEDNKSLLSQYWGSASLCHILPLFCSEVLTILKFFIQKLGIWQCKLFPSPILKVKENIYIYMLLEKKKWCMNEIHLLTAWFSCSWSNGQEKENQCRHFVWVT